MVLHQLLILVFTQNSPPLTGDDKTSVHFLGLISVCGMKAGKLSDSFFGISGDLSDNMVANSRAITVLTWANFYLAKLTISEEIGLASWQN